MNKNKIVIFAAISLLLVSTLALAANAAVSPTVENMRSRLLSASWVRLNGIVQQWGTEDAHGQLQTQARVGTFESSDTRQIASATAIWTTNGSRPIQGLKDKVNFTYTFYVARLVNASVSSLTTGPGSYSISGSWTVATVFSNVTIITGEDGTITRVLRNQDVTPIKADGVLTIADNKFTLSINGKDPLTGPVYRSITRTWNNPFKMNDDSAGSVVTKSDVKTIAANYGVMPGWGSFDTKMDFNNNYRVDIADISTVAANI